MTEIVNVEYQMSDFKNKILKLATECGCLVYAKNGRKKSVAMNNSVLRTKKWEAEKKTVLTRMAKQVACGEFGMNVEKNAFTNQFCGCDSGRVVRYHISGTYSSKSWGVRNRRNRVK